VDAIVLGHTLGRWAAAVVDGVPYAQPWAFGAEVGVIDLDLEDGVHDVELVAVDGERLPWTGVGSEEIAAAERSEIGRIEAPLRIDFGEDISLANFAAGALRAAAAVDGAVVPVVGMHQPAIAGVMYEWPAGVVSEAMLSRFWPWTDDGCLVADVAADELERVLAFSAPEPWLAWGVAGETPVGGGEATLAAPRDYVDWATVQIGDLLGRELRWRAVDVGLREAVRGALRG
jgi:hypothetical protein